MSSPVVERQPVACAHEWTDDGEFTLVCTKCGLEENCEPYGWVQTKGNAINHFTQEWDVVQDWEDKGFEYKPLFDTPPELAELQATIDDQATEIVRLRAVNADLLLGGEIVDKMCEEVMDERDQLKSEIERLKGGQGEPAAYGCFGVTVNGEPCDFATLDSPSVQSEKAARLMKEGKGCLLIAETPLYTSQPAPVSVVIDRDWPKEMMEIAKAPDYFPFPMEGCTDEWFIWNWSENKCRPINKYYLCDVLLADGRLLFDQSPYDFDWSGDQVFAARSSKHRDFLDKVKELNQ